MSIEVTDQLQRKIHFNEIPKRIVSLVPSQTELLCDLGLVDNVVGVTKFCVHPKYIKTKSTIVGGTKQINIDKIKALQPDVILCNKEENTEAIVTACKEICDVHVSDVYTLGDSLQLVSQYGKLFDRSHEAQELISNINKEFEKFKLFITSKTRFNTAYFIWKAPWMVAGNNTFIDYLLQLNKFDNYYGNLERYPEIELKKENKVDLVLLSSEPYPFKKAHIEELKVFYPKAKLLLVDGEMFSWYGSRLTKAFAYFRSFRECL